MFCIVLYAVSTTSNMPIYVAAALPQIDCSGDSAGIALLLRIQVNRLERLTLATLEVLTFWALVILRDGTTSGDATVDVPMSSLFTHDLALQIGK